MCNRSFGAVRRVTVGLACVAAVSLGGCETMRDDKNRLAAATIVGATAGAALGYWGIGGGGAWKWIAGAAMGVAGGTAGYLAMDYYNTMRKSDRATMERTVFKGLNETEAGSEIEWTNEETGNRGALTPRRTYLDDKGRMCRDFDSNASLDGVDYEGSGTACRNGAGNWVLT